MEAQSDKKGCLQSFLWTVAFLVIIVLISLLCFRWCSDGASDRRAYEDKKVYAFELKEFNQGANHYGEREYYKFFSDGTGMYLFESWHDSWDCDDPGCNLKSETRVSTFNYEIVDHRYVEFERYSSFNPETVRIPIDLNTEQIIISDDHYPLQLEWDSVNWKEVKKMLQR